MAQDLIVRTAYIMFKKVTHKVKEFVKRIALLQSFTSADQICKSLLLLKN
jgi:hypothetical protein